MTRPSPRGSWGGGSLLEQSRAAAITCVCPQADPVPPEPGRPHCPPEAGEEARRAAQSQVASSSGPLGRGWGRGAGPRRDEGAGVGSGAWVPPGLRPWPFPAPRAPPPGHRAAPAPSAQRPPQALREAPPSGRGLGWGTGKDPEDTSRAEGQSNTSKCHVCVFAVVLLSKSSRKRGKRTKK